MRKEGHFCDTHQKSIARNKHQILHSKYRLTSPRHSKQLIKGGSTPVTCNFRADMKAVSSAPDISSVVAPPLHPPTYTSQV